MNTKKTKTKAIASPKLEWNLTPLFKSDKDPEMETYKKDLEREYTKFIKKWKDRTDYLEDPKVLADALTEYDKLMSEYGGGGRLGYYLGLRTAQDQLDTNLKGLNNKTDEFLDKLGNELLFFSMRVSKIPQKEQSKFLKYPALKTYKHYLERSFNDAKYLLSESEEKIMNLKSGPAHSNWTRMVSTFTSKEERKILGEDGKKSVKNFSQLFGLVSSKNSKVRDSAVIAINEIVEKYIEVGEHEMNSILQNKKINDELRKTSRPDEMRHVSDDIDAEVVDALVAAVSANYKIAKDYYKLKAKLMGAEKLKYHERNVPFSKTKEKYTYDRSINLVLETFKNLDQEFYEITKILNDNGFIDVYPRKGKKAGACCAYHTINTPTYILLNHNDELNDVSTLAHELGHAINDELMKKEQTALNFGTPLSTAEVASTFMEDFVLQEIMKTADEEMRLGILMDKLNDDISTIFRQVAFYKFELDLHNDFRSKGYLSKEDIGLLFQKHMKSYMGDYVEHPDSSRNWWLYVGHFRSFFYVYSYASGLLISKSLQKGVKESLEFVKDVKKFLAAGESASPKEIFKRLGIDITKNDFWNKGIEEVKALLVETEKLAKKLKKI